MAENTSLSLPQESLTGAAWVREAFPRVGIPYVDLREGGLYTPENAPREVVERLIEQLMGAFEKTVDPNTQRTAYSMRRLWTVAPGVTGMGVLSGGLASFCVWARTSILEARKLLVSLKPLGCNPCRESIETATENLKSTLDALAEEFSQEPRPAKLDILFGDIGRLSDNLRRYGGFEEGKVLTPEDEEHFTNFRLVGQTITCLREAWEAQATELTLSLGVENVHITWKVEAIQETVKKLEKALSDLCLSGAARWITKVKTTGLDQKAYSMSLGAFLNLIVQEPKRWLGMIRSTGREGLRVVKPSVEKLSQLVGQAELEELFRVESELRKRSLVTGLSAKELFERLKGHLENLQQEIEKLVVEESGTVKFSPGARRGEIAPKARRESRRRTRRSPTAPQLGRTPEDEEEIR